MRGPLKPLPCYGHHDLFFSEEEGDEREAVALCRRCPERSGCRKGAHERRDEYGTFGGETRKQRLALLQIEYQKEPRAVTANRMTEELRQEVLQLTERGVSRREIAEKLGLTKNQVAGVLARTKDSRPTADALTEQDKRRIEELFHRNWSVLRISQATKRSTLAITDYLQKAGLQEFVPPDRKAVLGREFAQELRNGTPGTEIAAKHGVNYGTVRNWAKRYGGWKGVKHG